MPKRPEVDAWFRSYDNPMKDVVLAIREVLLQADKRMDECIKWQAPTFTFDGNLASFFPKSKKHASLMFHQGAKLPGKHPLLEGTGNTSRVLKLDSIEAVRAARSDLQAIVRAWIAWRTDAKPSAKKTPAKKTPATTPKSKKARAKASVGKKKASRKKAPTKKKASAKKKSTTRTQTTKKSTRKASSTAKKATRRAKPIAKASGGRGKKKTAKK